MRRNRHCAVNSAVILALGCVLAAMFPSATPAENGELRVLISDGMKTVVEQLTPQIERATGRKLAAEFDSSVKLNEKIQAGESFDAVIVSSKVTDGLVQQGKIVANTRVEIAHTGIGMGVRAGAARPDIGTPDAVKRTLLNAKSISFNSKGATAGPAHEMFRKLGIADAIEQKLMLETEAGVPQKNVAAGKVELVLSLIPEIKGFPGVDYIGPLPAELQAAIDFSGGVSANTKNSDAARALLKFLVSPAIWPTLKDKGMEPR